MGNFVSKNVINLSQRQLKQSDILLLSIGLKFVPTSNRIDKAKRKEVLEVFWRKVRLVWYVQNDKITFDSNKRFRPTSKRNSKNKDFI